MGGEVCECDSCVVSREKKGQLLEWVGWSKKRRSSRGRYYGRSILLVAVCRSFARGEVGREKDKTTHVILSAPRAHSMNHHTTMLSCRLANDDLSKK